MDLVYCILCNFLVVPIFIARCLYVCKDARDPSGKCWNYWSRSLFGTVAEMTASSPFMPMFLATNLLQVTDGDIEEVRNMFSRQDFNNT